jgi:hypothetical protein
LAVDAMRCIAQIKFRVALEEVVEEARTASGPSWIFAGLKRAHNFARREPITSALTVGRELGKRRCAQRFLVVPW